MPVYCSSGHFSKTGDMLRNTSTTTTIGGSERNSHAETARLLSVAVPIS